MSNSADWRPADGEGVFSLEVITGSVDLPSGLVIPLEMTRVTVGRDPQCGVQFGEDVPTVSRVHVALEPDQRGVVLRPLSRTNPTLVNGVSVSDPLRLQDGDEVQLSVEGPRLRFRVRSPSGWTPSPGGIRDPGELAPSRRGPRGPWTRWGAAGGLLLLSVFVGTWVLGLGSSRSDLPGLIEPLKPYVFALTLEGGEAVSADGSVRLHIPGEAPGAISCTGFILEGGTFITARHCVDAIVADDPVLNALEQAGGSITLRFQARNADGSTVLSFTREDLTVDASRDRVEEGRGPRGQQVQQRVANYVNGSDWAWKALDRDDGIPFDRALSTSLRAGTDLYVLGYSYGETFRQSGNLEPYFSTTSVTLSGLESGMIQVSNPGFDQGNSGGPAFALVGGRLRAVGLVTAGAVRGDGVPLRIGLLTPLAEF